MLPTFFEQPGQEFSSKFSIVGAPCDLNPPVSDKELRRFYKGTTFVIQTLLRYDYDIYTHEILVRKN